MTPQGRQPPPHLPLKPTGGLPDGSSRARDIDAVPARDWDRGSSSFWPSSDQRGWPSRSGHSGPRPGSSFRPSGPNGIGRRSPSPRRDFDRDRDRDRERDDRDRDRGRDRGEFGISREWAQYDREREARVREQDRRDDRREPRRSRALERADRAFDPRDRDERDRDRRFREGYRNDDRLPRSPRSRSRALSPPRRREDRPVPGPGPSTMAHRSPSRGSASPLDRKPTSPGELEEGEVVSPVRPARWNGDSRDRDRDRDRGRRWPSPGRERDRERDRDRDHDRGWGWHRSRPSSRQRSPVSPSQPPFMRPSDDGWASRIRAATSPAASWRSASRPRSPPRSPHSRNRSPETEVKPDISKVEAKAMSPHAEKTDVQEKEAPPPPVVEKQDEARPTESSAPAPEPIQATEPAKSPSHTPAVQVKEPAKSPSPAPAVDPARPSIPPPAESTDAAPAETEAASVSPNPQTDALQADNAKPEVVTPKFADTTPATLPTWKVEETAAEAKPEGAEPTPVERPEAVTATIEDRVEPAQGSVEATEDVISKPEVPPTDEEVPESVQKEPAVEPEITEPSPVAPEVQVTAAAADEIPVEHEVKATHHADVPQTQELTIGQSPVTNHPVEEPAVTQPIAEAQPSPKPVAMQPVAEAPPSLEPVHETPGAETEPQADGDIKMASLPSSPRATSPVSAAQTADADVDMTDAKEPVTVEHAPVEDTAHESQLEAVNAAENEPKSKDFAHAAVPALSVKAAAQIVLEVEERSESAVPAKSSVHAPAAEEMSAPAPVEIVEVIEAPKTVEVEAIPPGQAPPAEDATKAPTPSPAHAVVETVPTPPPVPEAEVEAVPASDEVEMADDSATAEKTEKTVTFVSPETQTVPLVRSTRSATERRSADLPDRASLPRASKERQSEPAQPSTDAETEGEPEEEMDPYELLLRENVCAAIKQHPGVKVDCDAILKWNHECSPSDSSRAPKDPAFIADDMIQEIVRPLNEEQKPVVPQVALIVAEEQAELSEKIETLREDYLQINKEWHEHCARLDRLMEKRGPPPAELYAIPGSILPAPTPGIPPTTPIVEETFPSRSNRRRGAGDAVATEAEYQAILAGLADSAAKDPTHRATKTAAIIPDMILTKERDFVYDDENYRVDDPLKFYDFAGVAEPIWSDVERAKFLKRYLQYPKQFGKIAEGIPDKSAGDCVLYYYRTKYAKDYKSTLASRRGVKARRAVAKKKSSALMADIERQKQTTGGGKSKREREREARAERERERTDPGGSAAGTPQPNGRKSRGRANDTPSTVAGEDTPVPPSRKRKTEDKTDNEESATPSRATSEAPSNASKKPRVPKSGGKKRPRPSSLKEEKEPKEPKEPKELEATPLSAIPPMPSTSTPVTDPAQQAALDHAAAVAIATMNGAPLPPASATVAPAVESPVLIDPTSQLPIDTGPLLPPVKRAKRRKQNHPPLDEAEVAVAEAASTPKPRRSGTNSYWSVAEKTKFPELVREHGTDFRAIADKLGGTKTVVQVRNHYNLTLDELRAKGIVQPQTNEVGVRDVKVNGAADAYGGFPPLRPPGDYAAPTTNLGNAPRRTSGSHEYPEPRMAVFPPSPHQQHAPPPHTSVSATPSAPPSRSGGMRISALLNDDPPKERAFDTASVASDGTVDEREFESSGGPPRRPSPRPPMFHEYNRRPSFDDHRDRFESSERGFRPASGGYSYAAAASAGTYSRDPRDPRDGRDVRERDPRLDVPPHLRERIDHRLHHEIRDVRGEMRDPRDLRDPRDMPVRDPRDVRDPHDYYAHAPHHSPPPLATSLPPVSRLASGSGGPMLPSLGVFPPSGQMMLQHAPQPQHQHGQHNVHSGHGHGHPPPPPPGHGRQPGGEYGRPADWRPYLTAPNGEREREYPPR